MVLIEIDSNAILVEAMKNRTTGEIIPAYQVLVECLCIAGINPTIHILDNECSAEFKERASQRHPYSNTSIPMTAQHCPKEFHRSRRMNTMTTMPPPHLTRDSNEKCEPSCRISCSSAWRYQDTRPPSLHNRRHHENIPSNSYVTSHMQSSTTKQETYWSTVI